MESQLKCISIHKWDIGTKTQIQYTSSTQNHLKTWCMPHYYYTFSYNMNQKFAVRFIALDTQSMLQYKYDGCQPQDKATGKLSTYCQGATVPDPWEQMEWFRNTLFGAQEDYVVIYSHHPLVSSGTLGLNTTRVDGRYCTWGFTGYPIMKQNISKIIREYIENNGDNILYLSQMFQSKTSNLMNMITGRMGRTNNVICGGQQDIDATYNESEGIQWNIKYADTKSAFGKVLFAENGITLQYHGISSSADYTDNVLYSQTIQHTIVEGPTYPATCPSDNVLCDPDNICTTCDESCGDYCQCLGCDVQDCGAQDCMTCPLGVTLTVIYTDGTGSCDSA
eukprot:4497_1